jgi:uncharacterized protein YjiS (DUF1127 family)
MRPTSRKSLISQRLWRASHGSGFSFETAGGKERLRFETRSRLTLDQASEEQLDDSDRQLDESERLLDNSEGQLDGSERLLNDRDGQFDDGERSPTMVTDHSTMVSESPKM